MDATGYIIDLLRRVSEVERRLAGSVKSGRVDQVDPAKGLVRLRLNPDDADEPFLSPWVPYAQMAGALKVHAPPSVGQQMTVIAGGGDYRQGVAVPMTWSDQNASPGDSGDENVLTFGDVRIGLKGGSLAIEVGGVSVEISGGGVKITGGKVEHDGKNIGSSHIHGGVETGPSNTDVPAN